MPATKSTSVVPASPLFLAMADLNRAQFASFTRPMSVDTSDLDVTMSEDDGGGVVIQHDPARDRQVRELAEQIENDPETFAVRFLALETQHRDLDRDFSNRIDSLERIVASYERMISKREWLADQIEHGGSY